MTVEGVGATELNAPSTDVYQYLVAALWRSRYKLLSLVVAAMAIAAAVSLWFITPVFEASGIVQVGPLPVMSQEEETILSLGSPDVYRTLLTSTRVMNRAAALAEVSPDSIAGAASATPLRDPALIRLTVKTSSAEQAAKLGEAWYQAFLAETRRQWVGRLEQALESRRAQMTGLKAAYKPSVVFDRSPGQNVVFAVSGDALGKVSSEITRLEYLRSRVTRSADSLDDVRLVAEFVGDPKAVSPRLTFNCMVAGLLGLVAGVSGVLASAARRFLDPGHGCARA